MYKTKISLKKYTMLLALVFIMILFQMLIIWQNKGSLFAPSNITNLISQNSYVVILATGMLMCILTGGNIDLSVGSIVALVGAIAGTLIVNMKANIYLSIAICLLAGTLLGAWQAFWIAYMRIPPFIVTLAGMLTFRGLALILLNGLTISPFPADYTRYFNSYLAFGGALNFSLAIGAVVCAILVVTQLYARRNKVKKGYTVEPLALLAVKLLLICAVTIYVSWLLGRDKGIPIILVLLAVVVLAYNYYTSNTVPGRYLYAMGGNEKAARLSGVDTNRTLFFAYTNMGFLAAIAALVCVARFNSAAPSAGTNYEMDAIASCYIGGASAFGGVGTVGGSVIGAVFMGVLNNGMSILGIDANWQRTVKGLVLLAAVIFDVMSKKRKQA
ncbi:multiple monosaccharide ABC transporter permease [Oscillospiraceae bacterium MB08-C2-2]|nr:multiple monosaccharide ABC transporter permease [Oscillospiraceae bacterium MB08-C2-2]